MSWHQTEITISGKSRGFNLITDEILNNIDISEYKVGVLYLHIMHTSASLTINENADSTVREDMESYFNKLILIYSKFPLVTYLGMRLKKIRP